ncbi:MAG: signal peptidase II, partial [Alphaproteobacteria bacterium]|nr:signal peptidase II [Alphaproteobacteria bacterium]
MFLGILVILAVVAADQFSKFWIDTQLVIDNPIVFNDYFNLIKVWNTGVSF